MTYANWQAKLKQRGEVDLAVRRNQLFEQTSRRWHANPPKSPVIAAGVTGAAPSLAKLLDNFGSTRRFSYSSGP